MKKRRNSLLAMAALLTVLLVLYFAMLKKDSATISEPSQESTTSHRFFSKNQEEIQSFAISNSTDLLFLRSSDTWVLDGYEDFKLNKLTVSTVSYSLAALESHGTIEGGDKSAFGLTNPLSVVTINFTDGAKETLYIGKATVDGKYHYITHEGDETVYTIDKHSADRFFYSYNEFLDKGLVQLNLTSLSEIGFKLHGKEYNYTLGLPYGVEYLGWFRDEYIPSEKNDYMLDMSNAYNALFAGLNDIRLTGVIMNGYENLAQYGLDDPSIIMNVYDDTNRLSFSAGNVSSDGLRYLMLEGDKYIYTADNKYFASIDSADVSALFDRKLLHVIAKQAETVTIKGVGPDRIIKPNANDEGKTYYSTIFELTWDSIIEPFETDAKSPIWNMNIQSKVLKDDINQDQIGNNDGNFELMNDGSINYQADISFYEYNSMFYAISRNGKPAATVIVRDKLDKVLTAIK